VNLDDLVGLEAWGPSRSLDLRGMQFGAEQHSVSPVRGHPRVTGQYALHFQCGWRLLSGEQELGGSAMQDREADELLRAVFGTSTASRVVAVLRDAYGVLRLEFDSRLVLEVLPGTEENHSEDWRLLRPGYEEPHLVSYGQRLALE
jgi:hypothetical protein